MLHQSSHIIFFFSIENVFSFAAGKKFQNVAKEGLSLDDSETAKAAKKEQTERFEPLLKWLGEEALKEHILRAELSERLASSPCALITSRLVSSFFFFFGGLRVCWLLLCLYRPFCIFERCLDSVSESKQASFQLSHPSLY